MRLLAIGDIHGCSRALDALLDIVSPASDDVVVALGDFIDWGPDSRGVLDEVVRDAHRVEDRLDDAHPVAWRIARR